MPFEGQRALATNRADAAPVIARSSPATQTPSSQAFAFGSRVDGITTSHGEPLDEATRASMEESFGADFSGVRIHADERAGASADALSAQAFAVGEHLVFGPGEYSPRSDTGRRLLAHELAHVIQQRTGTVQQAATVSQPGDPSELHAERIAEAVSVGGRAPALPTAQRGSVAGAVAIQRQPIPYVDRQEIPWFYPIKYALGDPHSVPVGKASRVITRGLEFISKWGRNASPVKVLWTYFKLNKSGFADLADVSERVKLVKELRSRVDELERDARKLQSAVNEIWRAEEGIPSYPLETDETAGHVWATPDELAYVEEYYKGAEMVANEAMDARAKLDALIAGWDDVMAKAKGTSDFTREAAWDAVTDLDLRFQPRSFRAFLVDARDRADQVESWARIKQFHAADILGKWTPPNYRAPTPAR